ncbi:Uncharacterized SAM-binding protein YcdF, DUF218 family [Actinacidiphila alni]|uniref:Uncharacterized SAM-binding protein YcdF, DUF218 family n=1 Tax=Actinacidiphila alni TaxID=380248 RepID=A0A1I1XJI5_9ACTN|nr:YdcF family protein [Actinacidiphila alni]SFE05903.1 Uncharacterized SAM-binding protein YcdF, DUF218 family [Actinacidiphila alni]
MKSAVAFIPTVLFALALAYSVRQDRRMFRNAVLLGLVVFSVGVALPVALPAHRAEPLVVGYFLLVASGGVALAVLLTANGVTMIRKEGRRAANLLSLLLGLAIAALFVLLGHLVERGESAASATAGALVLVGAYVSFLFTCFLGYAFLYGRIRVRAPVDYVLMLGCGLLGGERVSPLLASRLRKGMEVYERQTREGWPAPVMLTSGGQGPDELLPESEAMARWLVDHGIPATHVRQENRSRTTEQNLRYSREIMIADDPDYTCVVVTNNFHAFRAAVTARRAGVRGQVTGSATARYYWPSATIREFIAIVWEHRVANAAMAALLTAAAVYLAVP